MGGVPAPQALNASSAGSNNTVNAQSLFVGIGPSLISLFRSEIEENACLCCAFGCFPAPADFDLLSLLGGSCRSTTQPGPFDSPFEACANNGFKFAGPSFQCTGDRDCCLTRSQEFTDACEKRKGIRGAFWENLFGSITAACCKRN